MKKLQGNGLFESSRMMLPEHKEAYLEHQAKLQIKNRSSLDPQEVERISETVTASMQSGSSIVLTVEDGSTDKIVYGKVLKIDQQNARLMLCGENGREWIRFRDIRDAEPRFV